MTCEILFLAHRIPYPPDKGDKIRSWRLLEHLASSYRVHLAAFVDAPEDFQHQEFLESVCESVTLAPLDPRWAKVRSLRGFAAGAPLSLAYYDDAKMRRAVRELRARPLAAEIAFSSTMAQYLEPAAAGRARLVDICDADSEKWKSYAERANGVMGAVYAHEARKLAQVESAIVNGVDAVFAVSAPEADILTAGLVGAKGAARKVHWFGNGVDTAYFSADAVKAVEARVDVVFVGAMDYRPNVDAATWFLTDVWPQIRERNASAQFAIVGAHPPASLRAFDGRDGVRVTGRVSDVRPWLAAAKVSVAPMRIARGVQNKVLEAMAMALPVIATPAAMEGIDHVRGLDVVVEADARAMAQSIVTLLGVERRRRDIGAKARERIVESYQWARQLARFDAVASALIPRV
ncbi:MAG: TIGR03087 family PEP-CTERM/XrtA system glycosyltransferase [Parvularculaceae bacterium]|nr:TIGR03087 family PEP-CTERM/XrtA system glycosyltransferase [Parvularculaceae bacterium]